MRCGQTSYAVFVKLNLGTLLAQFWRTLFARWVVRSYGAARACDAIGWTFGIAPAGIATPSGGGVGNLLGNGVLAFADRCAAPA